MERWRTLPADVCRGFKTHSAPGPFLEFRRDAKYLVMLRNPEEALCSLHPFLLNHTDEIWALWNNEAGRAAMQRPTFRQWLEEVAFAPLPPPPSGTTTTPGAPPPVDGGTMLNVWFASFINGWWPFRNEPNVLMLHFSELKADHEGSVRRIAAFLGFRPTAEQWPRVLEHTSFPWMKAHEEKFETITAGTPEAPVAVLKHGHMVRSEGRLGAQREDGMTDELAAAVRARLERLIHDPEALRFMYDGSGGGGGRPQGDAAGAGGKAKEVSEVIAAAIGAPATTTPAIVAAAEGAGGTGAQSCS